MATVATQITRARVKIRDEDSLFFTSDTTLFNLIKDIIEEVYTHLVKVESKFVYAHSTITLTAGTGEYTPTFSHNGFVDNGSWLIKDGAANTVYLFETTESQKNQYNYLSGTSEPEAYYHTEDGKVGFLWVPDSGSTYTVQIQYWKPVSQPSGTSGSLPWNGTFDRYIERRLVVDLLEIMERDNSRQAILASQEWDAAMNMVYRKGLRQRRVSTNMFSSDLGI